MNESGSVGRQIFDHWILVISQITDRYYIKHITGHYIHISIFQIHKYYVPISVTLAAYLEFLSSIGCNIVCKHVLSYLIYLYRLMLSK